MQAIHVPSILRRIASGQSHQFWLLAAFLIAAFLLGGGSRRDILSLVILRPMAVIACGYGFWRWSRAEWADNRVLLYLFGLAFALVAVHLVPLPPALWQGLPGRTIIVDIDRSLGQPALWRPLTMAPEPAVNALFSLFVPLAVLALLGTVDRQGRHAILLLLIGLGIVSGFLALLQIAAPGNQALYLYGDTDDLAVGLFANRNHAAIYLALLFPMLATYARTGTRHLHIVRLRAWSAFLIGLVLVPLILVTGSRNGLLLGFAGLLCVPILLAGGSDRHKRKTPWARSGLIAAMSAIVLSAVALTVATIGLARGAAVDRLLIGTDSDKRLLIWSATWQDVKRYFPFGSGAGSFVEAYKVGEPLENLSRTYANHAHNDWLEIAMTMGVPGIILLTIVVSLWGYGSWRAWRVLPGTSRNTAYARLASLLLLLLALASIADYPTRVPSLMCLAVILATWLGGTPRASDDADAAVRDVSTRPRAC